MTADMLKDGSDWLQDQQKAHVAQMVTYSRGGQQLSISATIGRTEFDVDPGDGFGVRVEARDYLIHAADLVLGGVTVKPQRGDRIRETRADGDTAVYEVMSPADGEPVWRYSDDYRRRLRIHTKEVDTEET